MQPTNDAGAGRETAEGKWQRETVQYFPRRLIVKLKTPTDATEAVAMVGLAEAVANDAGGSLVRPPSHTGRLVIELGEGAKSLDVAKKFSRRSDIEYVEPDVVDHAAIVPNDTRYAEQWALPKVNAPAAWDLETGKTTVLIGVIDSGISMSAGGALDHPDLNDATRITLGTDFVDGGTPRDLNGHGTHVVGIAAAAGNNATGVAGMNWGSRIYICRTLDANGNGSSADFADAVEEITDFAVANNLKAVINYSGGGAANQTKLDACNYASSRGMILCAATGNDNAGPVIWPAAYSTIVPGVIAVGSTTDTDAVSGFSNVGPEVTVVAPGSGILSAMPTYAVTIPGGVNFGTLNGTSMATPLVTGLAALMWSKNSGKTNAAIKQCLIDTAVKLGAVSFHNSWGNGRVDAEAALKCVEPLFVPVITTISPACAPSVITPCRVISQVTACLPSRFTLCVPSTVTRCLPSRLPRLCQVSQLPWLCTFPSSVGPSCEASWVDACPSALDPNCGIGFDSNIGCRVTPTDVTIIVNPVVTDVGVQPNVNVGPAIGRFGARELGRAGSAGPSYYWVDDAGETHPWQADADTSAEVWRDRVGQYFWIDDAGNVHPWPPASGGSGG
jgi:Subtilase family